MTAGDGIIVTAAQVTAAMSDFLVVVTDNIVAILALLAFSWGIYFVINRLRHAQSGHIG